MGREGDAQDRGRGKEHYVQYITNFVRELPSAVYVLGTSNSANHQCPLVTTAQHS